MSRFCGFVMATLLMLVAAPAQQTGGSPASEENNQTPPQATQSSPGVEQHIKMFRERLGLSEDQANRIRPALQRMHDATEQLMQDQTLSQDQRRVRQREIFAQADHAMRAVLNDSQKQKLDEFEHEHQAEMHGGTSGSDAPQR